jgi:hypothetical protein
LVVRVVASLIVALGRERDAAIIFIDDLWFRVEACEPLRSRLFVDEWPR